ncbi:MAG: isoprenylcysteine carboxylmethyltransferase family protein [Candidatus Omnitrophica bacterium]|nr:isoprenylcysteine carboxylmethyltransferase family protein [Candidatus Omnitrophota bacterium]
MKMLQVIKKTRFFIVYPVIGLVILPGRTSDASRFWGALVVLLGEGVRGWANGYVGHNKVNRTRRHEGEEPIGRLITAGPYGWVRHPLYLGTLLIFVGVGITAGNPWLMAVAVAFFAAIYARKTRQEDMLLAAECGAMHERYFVSVPRFFPKFKHYGVRQGEWNWAGIRASQEWKTVIWLVILYIFLYLREEWYQEREFLASGEVLKHSLWFGLMAALVVGDLALQIISKRRRRPS